MKGRILCIRRFIRIKNQLLYLKVGQKSHLLKHLCALLKKQKSAFAYFTKEELTEDLAHEQAVEVRFEKPTTLENEQFGTLSVDSLIVFTSGRFAANFSRTHIPIIVVHEEVVTVWYCQMEELSTS